MTQVPSSPAQPARPGSPAGDAREETALLPAQLEPEAFGGPWAMQLAIRYVKAELPTHAQACASAARAVVTLLPDERSRGDGPWAPAVHRWRDGRIRKLVRRARGVRWERVQDVPGITVVEGAAQVRAFVPLPARPLPPLLDELQVSGTDYPRRDDAVGEAPAGEAPAGEAPRGERPDAPGQGGQRPVTIALTPLVDLTTGKAAAQCGHAAQLAWEALVLAGESEVLRRWHDAGWAVRVIDHCTPTQWAAWETSPVRVIDAGFTEVDGPTETARAWW